MLAIADLAGPEWSERAVTAARKLSGDKAVEDDSIGVQLLSDIRDILGEGDRILTRDLVEKLAALEESPWREWSRGDAISPRQLARFLRPYDVTSTTIRHGEERGKGYMAEAFEDAFSRYLPPVAASIRDKRDNRMGKPDSGDRLSVTGTEMSRIGNGHKPHHQADVTDVTDQDLPPAAREVVWDYTGGEG